jgi:hypothetical protein
LDNESGAQFTDTAASSITSPGFAETFANQGNFTVNIGAAQQTAIAVNFTHTMGANALIQVTSGKLSFQGSNGSLAAQMTANPGASVEFVQNTKFTLGRTGSFTGAGQFVVGGLGELDVPDGVNFSVSSTLVLDVRGLIQNVGPAGSGVVSSSQIFTWKGGTIMTEVTSSGQMQITGANDKTLDYGRLDNNGSATWDGTGDILMNDNALLYNIGTFEVKNNQTFRTTKNDPNTNRLIKNADDTNGHVGTFKKTVAGTTSTGNLINFLNQGLLDLSQAICTLALGNSFTQAGANSNLKIGLFGGAAGQYSQVKVDVDAWLGGNLTAVYGGTYTGKKGDSFQVFIANSLNGTSFNNPVILPPPPAGAMWAPPTYNRAPINPENLTLSLV